VGVSRWASSLDGLALNHTVEFQGGLLEAECREQLQTFFRRRRG
jgi:tRNA(adenine34) deaminase